MKVIELPVNENELSYPEEINKLVQKLQNKNIKLNVDKIILEKLWYVFSEKYDATFLVVDNDTIDEFIEWAKDIDYEFAQKCNYYGYIEEE
ncbi:MAG: hypothetical protein J6V44_14960 [Methanobrevibacter sp.]|nr:hypothetical protein [Methanobrevibacter sp.]MBO7692752.1 hypothetical protein [Methanobrevibacter sp.]